MPLLASHEKVFDTRANKIGHVFHSSMDAEHKNDQKDKKINLDRFVDDSSTESPSKRRKRGRPKLKGTPKQRRLWEELKKEAPKLLKLLNDPESRVGHYECKHTEEELKVFAGAFKWIYSNALDEGYDAFWNWWSHPMKSLDNIIWRKKFDDECHHLDYRIKEQKLQKAIDGEVAARKEIWDECYNQAIPTSGDWYEFKRLVEYEMKKQQLILNPEANDDVIAKLVDTHLKDTFVVLDADRSTATWEPRPKLWIIRKKDTSHIAMSQKLIDMIDHGKILFTDAKARDAFMNLIKTNGCAGSFLRLCGLQTVFPHPMKRQLNKATWSLPLKNGLIVDFRTLEIREREKSDYFSVETGLKWIFTEQKQLDIFIAFCQKGGDYIKANYLFLIEELTRLLPDAMQFVRGPFQQSQRLIVILQYLGLFATSHCSRTGLWVYGDGKGMKSTVFDAIRLALGPFAVVLAKKVFFETYGSETSHTTDVLRAEHKRMGIIDELTRQDRLKEPQYKQHVSHQQTSGREIYGGQTEWDPNYTPVCLTNAIPTLTLTDKSIPDRIISVCATTRVFSADDCLVDLPPHFQTVSDWKDGYDPQEKHYWVLKRPADEKWALSFQKSEEDGGKQNQLGALMFLMAHVVHVLVTNSITGSLFSTPICETDKAYMLQEADPMSQFIAEAAVITDEKDGTPFISVWNEYKDLWCKEASLKPVPQRVFRQAMTRMGLLYKGRRKVGGRGGTQDFLKVALKSNMLDNDPRLDL